MGIARPPDPYGMTAPPAWPDVDEDILRGCRDAFDTVLKTVTTQWEAAKRERPQMFEGAGIWSGGAADAAHKALRERIADLESVKGKLQASVDLFNNCIKEIVDAKNQIIDIVDIAHNLIDKIQNDPQIEDKAAAIQAIVDAARNSQHHDCRRSRGARFRGSRRILVTHRSARKRTPAVRPRRELSLRPVAPVANAPRTGGLSAGQQRALRNASALTTRQSRPGDYWSLRCRGAGGPKDTRAVASTSGSHPDPVIAWRQMLRKVLPAVCQ